MDYKKEGTLEVPGSYRIGSPLALSHKWLCGFLLVEQDNPMILFPHKLLYVSY